MAEKVTVSVRNLVEFILRSGDIDNTRGYKDPDAMQEGSRIHRKIQKSMPSGYAAEVVLKTELSLSDGVEELLLTVEGRADGIWLRDEESNEILIDEIKSMYQDVSHIKEPVKVHTAQAKCYAHIYAEQHELEKIGVQMTYVNIETEAVKRFEEWFTREELRDWFQGLVKEYSKWLFWQRDWTKKEMKASKDCNFHLNTDRDKRTL